MDSCLTYKLRFNNNCSDVRGLRTRDFNTIVGTVVITENKRVLHQLMENACIYGLFLFRDIL